jgi:hypothetical protein
MPRDHAYCTLFDRNYASRGLALYRSLERHDPSFRLFAVCMDAETKALLDRLDAPRLVTVGLDELEAWDPELAAVRPSRTAIEYAWTAVPATCRYVLHREPAIETVTYVDADLLVFSSPQPLFDELDAGAILIVPHRHADPRDEIAPGRFNVGWVMLRRDANGTAAIEWWRERCLEWCHARVEPGRFGDQKYLDEWPARFAGVRVCEHPGAGLAPWNQDRHEIAAAADGSLLVDGRPLVFFHYSGLTLHPGGGARGAMARRSRAYRTTGDVVWTVRARHGPLDLELVWEPYVARCMAAHAELDAAGAPPSLGVVPLSARGMAAAILRESAPTRVRDAHLALHRRRLARRATRGGRGLRVSAAPRAEEPAPAVRR